MQAIQVVTVGGGPAGLYLAILLRRADPAGRVVVLERNAPDDAYGWGVVFSEQTLATLAAADPDSYAAIERHFVRWDDIAVHAHGRVVTSGGHGFVGVARQALLRVLAGRARALGAELRFGCAVEGPDTLATLGLDGADVIVAADGVHSALRRAHADVFRPDLDVRPARFVWLGTTRRFDAFSFLFAERGEGIYQAHAYRFDAHRSAFIVECDERSWRAAGFDAMDADATVAACEALFAPWLEGHALAYNLAPHQRAAPWQRFTRVANERWHARRVVLLGDAAHTAHFSIGSGTKLAMEDAIALADALTTGDGTLAERFARYQAVRQSEAMRLQNAARNSMEWFEHVGRYYRALPTEQFAYSLLTRSQRVGHENLRVRDGGYVEGVERWMCERGEGASGGGASGEGGTGGGVLGGADGGGGGRGRRGGCGGVGTAGAGMAGRILRGWGRRGWWRRCSRGFGCGGSCWPTASSSRRWPCTRPPTGCPTTSTSCTTGRGRWVGRGSSSPR